LRFGLQIGVREQAMVWRTILLITCLAVLAWFYQGLLTLHSPQGDFVNHREWGRRFVEREFLYTDALNLPYPPCWAAVHAPFAILSPTAAWSVHLVLGFAALLALTILCHSLVSQHITLSWTQWVCVHSAVLVILSRAILRDLQDGGANLILVTCAMSSVFAWTRNRDRLGGAFLGLAIALKCTAGLVLLWFLWRRQWRIAGFTLLWAVLFSVSPLLWLGPESFLDHILFWLDHLRQGLLTRDATHGILGPEEFRNVALRPTVARLISSPVATVAMVAVLGLGLWRCRRPLERRDTATALRESGIVFVMMLLLSPITWNPHCVAALPVLMCLLATVFSVGQVSNLPTRTGWKLLLAALLVLIALALRNPLSPALLGSLAGQLYTCGAMTGGLVLLFVLSLCYGKPITSQDTDRLSNCG